MTTSAPLTFENHDIATVLGRIRVRSVGAGPVIMFWSSLLMNGSMWHEQAAYFRDHFRVLLVDPPGHGDSEALSRSFSFKECALCIVQILDALGVPKTHFVGNSWGGMIGGTFAALYPDRVGVSVLMNCTATEAGVRQRVEYILLINLIRLLGRIPPFIAGSAVRAFVGPTTERERPGVASAIRSTVSSVNGRSVYWAIKSVVPDRPDQHILIASIRTPVLVIAGAEDRTFPVEETRAMAAAIPRAEFRALPGVAHLAGLECPAETNAMIDAFIGAHATGAYR